MTLHSLSALVFVLLGCMVLGSALFGVIAWMLLDRIERLDVDLQGLTDRASRAEARLDKVEKVLDHDDQLASKAEVATALRDAAARLEASADA